MRTEGGDPRVAVCICTWMRPQQLGRLLKSLASMERPDSTLFVIVDNDGNDPEVGRCVSAFRALCGNTVEYVVEPAPGLSAARNAAIAAARDHGAEAVAMLDDDEWASPDWLAQLLETRRSTGASIVGGPVQPVFPDSSAIRPSVKALWSVPQGRLHGKPYVYCTCNCLFDLDAIANLGAAPFDDQFAFTGGEDAVFFRRLFFAGVSMAWSERAILFEEYTPERASHAWLRRRWYRQGNVGPECERAAPDPKGLPPLLKSLLLAVRLPFYPLVNRRVFAVPFLWLLESERVRGRFARHLGFVFQEYARR